MKRTALLIILIAAAAISNALIGDHLTFNATTATYAPITGTAIPIDMDDALSGPINLGISFPYCGQYFTQVKVCSNGWINLGTNQDYYDYSNDMATNSVVPILAPLWDDLSLNNGSAQYLLSGTVPYRVFTIQYANANWNYSSASTFNFQVRLHEFGKIEFIYGPSTGLPSGASASIGINATPGGTGWYYSVTPGSPATASTNEPNDNINMFPAAGTCYEFNPVMQYPDDLACLSLSGDVSPTAGEETTFTASVSNPGTSPQAAYQVKLFRAGDVEVASATGSNIDPGATQTIQLAWTPAMAGPEQIHARVVLNGDQNPDNDQSPILLISVQPENTSTVTIGAGNELNRLPLDFYWHNSLYECLYFPSELGFSNTTIYALEFYNDFDSQIGGKPTKIWLGTTNLANLSAGWIPSTQLVPVFDGQVIYPLGENAVTIPLQLPYLYGSGNLVMLVNRPLDAEYYSYSSYFKTQNGGAGRALVSWSDSDILDPASPPSSAVPTAQFPKTTIYYAGPVGSDDPAVPEAATRLLGSSPNPFAGQTSVHYSLERAGEVSLRVYNLKGQMVRTLAEGEKAAGSHSAAWDGRDSSGRQVSSGLYLLRMQAGKFESARRLVLVK